ncbi:hypothetical protein LQV05_006427 [Cryptococcus neoformans]|nr:hypothetical protein LQV05_006427 [Cryptococcus neoformans]
MSNVQALTPYRTHRPSNFKGSPIVHSFFDDATSTWTFVVADPQTKCAMIIDPVLDYDQASGGTSMRTAQGLAAFTRDAQYEVVRVMETHVHADHATAAFALKTLLPGSVPTYIGRKVEQVQQTFASIYGFKKSDFMDCFDGFVDDGDELKLGELTVQIWSLPGHTPDSMGFLVGDCLFAGDSLFLPDVGTARADFPGGSAESLFNSGQLVMRLAGNSRVFSGHDYPVGREKSCMSLVSEQSRSNKHVGGGTTLEEFTKMRDERDAQLGTPRLFHAAMQINLRGGRMPLPDAEGRRFIRTPLSGKFPL